MCGIFGAVSDTNITDKLINGLYRLEYRGYDSSSISILDSSGQRLVRCVGRVAVLHEKVKLKNISGATGIGHTRWATHGIPSVANAHPHLSHCVAVVHNGIIENFISIKESLIKQGYVFKSDTDSEVIAHLIYQCTKNCSSLIEAVRTAIKSFHGSYSIAVTDSRSPGVIVIARQGSPLVIGIGDRENFVSSDQIALMHLTNRFIFLEENCIGEITKDNISIYNIKNEKISPKIEYSALQTDSVDLGKYKHFMLKEINEQPEAIYQTLEGRLLNGTFHPEIFGINARELLSQVQHVSIVACGSSYHAGLVARYWLEEFAHISCNVEIASEFRYRKSVIHDHTLLVTISQSGETADTLEALRLSKETGIYATLGICNVPGSTLVRESDLYFMTRAGAEIGVASTKAFLTQLTALLLLTGCIGVCRHTISLNTEKRLVSGLLELPNSIKKILMSETKFYDISKNIYHRHSCLFLGRGINWPIAQEGALKLKEISYIHAEAYAAGELKHGPIALIDENMPVIVIAPSDKLSAKLLSNVETVRARNGELYILTDSDANFLTINEDSTCKNKIITLPKVDDIFAPIIYTIPLQLIAYYAAVLRGTEIDRPRNLAKSVTVE